MRKAYIPTLEEILQMVKESTKPTIGICNSVMHCLVAEAIAFYNPEILFAEVFPGGSESDDDGIGIRWKDGKQTYQSLPEKLDGLAQDYDDFSRGGDYHCPPRELVIQLLENSIAEYAAIEARKANA